MLAWVNGRILDNPADPAITVSDHGFTVGDGVFEAAKVVDGQPFALTPHLDRLAVSARGLGLPPAADALVPHAAAESLHGPDLPLGRFPIQYPGGVEPLGRGPGAAHPTPPH